MTLSTETITTTGDFLGHPFTQTEVLLTRVPVATSTSLDASTTLSASSSSSSQSSSSTPSALSTSSVSSTSDLNSSSTSITSASASNTADGLAPPSQTSAPGVPGISNVGGTVTSSVTAAATPTDGAASASASTVKGPSGGAIAGIVTVCVLAALIIGIWIARKIFLRRRQNRRDTFLWPKPDFDNHDRTDDISEKMFIRTENLSTAPPVPEKPFSPSVPTPPPMAYNSPVQTPVPTVQSPTLQAGGAAVPLAQGGANFAFVRCTYIPNLPDELSITVGETVRVLSEYDDGWAMCLNSRNEQGVVPIECLDKGGIPSVAPGQYIGQGTGDWRMSRRASSLHGAQNAPAMRY